MKVLTAALTSLSLVLLLVSGCFAADASKSSSATNKEQDLFSRAQVHLSKFHSPALAERKKGADELKVVKAAPKK